MLPCPARKLLLLASTSMLAVLAIGLLEGQISSPGSLHGLAGAGALPTSSSLGLSAGQGWPPSPVAAAAAAAARPVSAAVRAARQGPQRYWGEENWGRPSIPPADMPGLDADGCYSALRAANYSVVARCGKPVPWARPLAGGPSEVLNPIGRCAFVTDRRCCHMADGAVWSIYRTDTLPPKAAFKARRRDFPQQVWLGESMENVDSYPSRPVGDQGYMDALDYAAYFGPGADFPVLPNYDYRNRIQRDLLAWPGRNVHFRTAAPLQQLLANKTGGVLYLSSDCVGLRGSQRDTFVKALMTYLHVDSLGKCLNNVPRADQHHSGSAFRASSATIMARYRFRLLIPNSLCEDYVVEKYSQALLHATIPIFLGAPNARRNYDPGVAAVRQAAALH
eukprot:COSAG01_NODE_1283_length_10920_cov_5.539507_2_plen_392_part_00